eukprot:7114490-Ditylum_brightwellii.AAC.1
MQTMEDAWGAPLDGFGRKVMLSMGPKGKGCRFSFVPSLGPPKEIGRSARGSGAENVTHHVLYTSFIGRNLRTEQGLCVPKRRTNRDYMRLGMEIM